MSTFWRVVCERVTVSSVDSVVLGRRLTAHRLGLVRDARLAAGR
jgi:hypothetical protein